MRAFQVAVEDLEILEHLLAAQDAGVVVPLGDVPGQCSTGEIF